MPRLTNCVSRNCASNHCSSKPDAVAAPCGAAPPGRRRPPGRLWVGSSQLANAALPLALFVVGVFAAAPPLSAQTENAPPHGIVQRIKVHGKSLQGNLEGDSPDRDVSLYLPPSYEKDRSR